MAGLKFVVGLLRGDVLPANLAAAVFAVDVANRVVARDKVLLDVLARVGVGDVGHEESAPRLALVVVADDFVHVADGRFAVHADALLFVFVCKPL